MTRFASRLVLAAVAATYCLSAAAADRPNILFVYTDDQAAWAWGGSGNPQAHTPNIDRLARDGATFTNFFCSTPVCSPARASVMTGRYASEFGILDFIPHPGHVLYDPAKDVALPPESITFAEVLKQAGYRTGLVGKWHLGDWEASGNLDRHPTHNGFDYFMGLPGGGTTPDNPVLEEDGKIQTFPGLCTDILTDRALAFIERCTTGPASAQPFLLCLNYRAPHARWLPVADADWAPYEDLDPQLPNPDYPDLDVAKAKRRMREYLASTSGVDRNLRRVLDLLEAKGVADNTVVIFSADNGYNMGHNGIEHKGNGIWITKHLPPPTKNIASKYRPNMYDTSLKVPLIVRWPGVVKPGTVVDTLASSLDLFPTLAEIAGATIPQGKILRGRSIVPLLKGRTPEDWPTDYYGEYSMINYCTAYMRCYRTPEWKLIRDFLNPERDELYHLSEDPAERVNRINDPDPAVRAVISRLHAKIIEHMQAISDPLLDQIERQ